MRQLEILKCRKYLHILVSNYANMYHSNMTERDSAKRLYQALANKPNSSNPKQFHGRLDNHEHHCPLLFSTQTRSHMKPETADYRDVHFICLHCGIKTRGASSQRREKTLHKTMKCYSR